MVPSGSQSRRYFGAQPVSRPAARRMTLRFMELDWLRSDPVFMHRFGWFMPLVLIFSISFPFPLRPVSSLLYMVHELLILLSVTHPLLS